MTSNDVVIASFSFIYNLIPMSNQPIDTMEEDGFHSIAWDDAPQSRYQTQAASSPLDDADGFEAISPVSGVTSPPPEDVEDEADRPKLQHSKSARAPIDAPRTQPAELDPAEWKGKWMSIQVTDPVREHEGSKDQYVSYAAKTQTNLPAFPRKQVVVRRRFQDFVFLREYLVKNFPASIVPPIPDKHRLEYIKGDRFAPEFVEKRRYECVVLPEA